MKKLNYKLKNTNLKQKKRKLNKEGKHIKNFTSSPQQNFDVAVKKLEIHDDNIQKEEEILRAKEKKFWQDSRKIGTETLNYTSRKDAKQRGLLRVTFRSRFFRRKDLQGKDNIQRMNFEAQELYQRVLCY